MVLTYYGFTCFKLQSGDTVVALDPFGKGSDLSSPRFETHVVALTNPDAKTNFSLTGDPMVLSTPGEYEIRGMSFMGFDTPSVTPFYIECEGIKLLTLGSITKQDAIESILDHIDTIDILLLSSAGTPTETQKLVTQIDPRIIVLMRPDGAKKGSSETMAKELGEKPEHLDKLTIKQKGLPAESQRLIILESDR
jgi:hypothetical protein